MPLPNNCPRCGETYSEGVAFCATDGTRLARGVSSNDLIGTVIADRYRVVSRLGEGGMGQVYLAEHVRMKRKSAIKIMRPALVGDVEALQRFTREAENASQLSHPNIAAIFDFGETDDGVVYLAMEYVDGESLAARLERDAALHPDVAADILGQAADALQAAHDLQMLHRDIKPDNIMLGSRPDGTYMVKLVDFGIARTMDGSNTRVTRTGFSVGTPQYMSPEQLAGDTLDPASDQYALALVAFYALTGRHAFPTESSKESLIARLTSRPRTLQDARQDVEWPEPLQAVFNRALAPDSAERFSTISDFAHALTAAISEMTPTQTAELYRRALDARVASVAARTPHTDREGFKLQSGGMAAVSGVSTTGGLVPADLSGTATGERDAATGARSLAAQTGAPTGAGDVDAAAARSGSRGLVMVGGVVVVAGLLWAAFGRGGSTTATPPVIIADSASTGDTAAAVYVPPPTGATAATDARADSGAAGASGTASVFPGGSLSRGAGASDAVRASAAAADGVQRRQRDSVRLATERARAAQAESAARAASVRARFPDASARAAIARGVDGKARIVRSGDVRAVIMSTPVFLWRAEQGQAYKQNKRGPGDVPYEIVDPIEQWSAWKTLVGELRAVYVIEVTTEKAPWPSFEPGRIFEIKRGNVESVELLRDGTPVALEQTARIAAMPNADAHTAAGKPVPHAIVAAVSPTTFMPREDGSLPRIEILVRDAARAGETTRIRLSDSLVRRLYEDFAPWRDAIARR